MKETEGNVTIWNNIGVKPIPEGYNVVSFYDLAMKTDITEAIATSNAKQALLTSLGVPGPYADDTAAQAGGVPVGGVYYITTTLLLHTRMA